MPATFDSSPFPSQPDVTFNTHHIPGAPTTQNANLVEKKAARGLFVGPTDCRHLGAQLRPHIFSRLFHLDSWYCAGLVSKDLSEIGGHEVINFGEAALETEDGALSLIHLGCDSMITGLVSGYHRATEGVEESRVMSLIQVAARDEMIGYVKRRSGQTSPLAYILAPRGCFSGSDITFFGLRLPEPSVLEDDQEEHLVSCAGEASFVGVSGKSAETFFTDRGVECVQMPCGLSVLPRLCNKPLGDAMEGSAALQNLRDRFGKGWIAVEVGDIPERQEKDFADAVSSMAVSRGWGIAIYSAKSLGEESGSDRRRWETLLGSKAEATWVDSPNVWDIALLIGNSEFYVGSCLDSRIIAASFSVPRINTPRADRRNIDYCEAWEEKTLAAVLGDDHGNWGAELNRAANADRSLLQEHAEETARAFFDGFSQACQTTSLAPRLFAGENIDHLQAMAHGQKIAADWMRTARERKQFVKMHQKANFSDRKPSVTDGVKKVVSKFIGESQ